MKVKFWGVRGSIPIFGPKNTKYGGNTSCIEVNCDDKTIILDARTGIMPLGLDIMAGITAEENHKKSLYIFFSHVHWDHIQGYPFFRPAFHSEFEIYLYSTLQKNIDIESALRSQMNPPFFPIQLQDMSASTNFNNINSGENVQIGNVTVEGIALDHPDNSLGYKITYENKSVAYISDHEHTDISHERIVDFLKGTKLVIFDAHYTPEEYSGSDGDGGRKGWGHSTWEEAVALCIEAKIDRLALTHHGREDSGVDRIESEAQSEFRNTIAAYEV
ncbi:MAG: MBL fold metallo-hydrolase [Candidatus Scalindua sp.]|jgi:phosphoribosyl 1,2-cyclic phosphodiesterase|nr:MBL fold metallo-hydrolase [Candidatus Scalindua sp.]MDV5166700.1 MBL fold metallo-hydrolase [Candidatus Scalindua sp.]